MAIVLDGTSGITAPAVDATLDGADLTSGSVTSTQLATAIQPIGVGQTWQNVTASRSVAVTYTNTTGRPIMVHVNGVGSSSANAVRIVVGGVALRDEFDVVEGSIQAIVPDNTTYIVYTPNGINEWCELR